MLLEFKVKNFKNFRKELHFKLCEAAAYDYNANVIRDGVVNTAVIYGRNGSGKTNFGLAIFDIILHLTDKEKSIDQYRPYKNLYADDNENVEFFYKFCFNKHILEYRYAKKNENTLLNEEIKIDSDIVIESDYSSNIARVYLEGAETLNTNLTKIGISFVKYVANNTMLDRRKVKNKVFLKFMEFVNNMLFFSSLDHNRYRGYSVGAERIPSIIVKKGKVAEFEQFLSEAAGVKYELRKVKMNNEDWIFCKFGKKMVDFYQVASQGTRSLALFYVWLLELENVSLVYMDEFDAFYHFRLAEELVKRVKTFNNTQAIFSTHNTNIMTSDILRPDCYYIIDDEKIDRLNNLTDKDLRQAHDLQRMYKAGAFDDN